MNDDKLREELTCVVCGQPCHHEGRKCTCQLRRPPDNKLRESKEMTIRRLAKKLLDDVDGNPLRQDFVNALMDAYQAGVASQQHKIDSLAQYNQYLTTNLRPSGLVSEWQARAEKAEAELAEKDAYWQSRYQELLDRSEQREQELRRLLTEVQELKKAVKP